MKKQSISLLLFVFAITFFTSCKKVVQENVLPKVINKQMDERLTATDILKDTESITIVTVGTGTPFSLDRSMSGTAIIVNGNFFMFDVGPGVVAQIELQKSALLQKSMLCYSYHITILIIIWIYPT